MPKARRGEPGNVSGGRMRLLLVALLGSLALLTTVTSSASASLALGLTGASGPGAGAPGNEYFNSEPDWEALQHSGATVFRMQFNWENVATSGWASTYDVYVEKAAKHGITIVPCLYGAPGLRQTFFRESEPGWSEWLNTFIWQAVSRYAKMAPFGLLTRHPQHPITAWEVWNKPNSGDE